MRRLVLMLSIAACLTSAYGEERVAAVRVEFGQAGPAGRWAGQVEGPLLRLSPWLFVTGRVDQKSGRWETRIAPRIAPFQRNPVRGANFPEPRRSLWPAGLQLVLRRGDSATIRWSQPKKRDLPIRPDRIPFGRSESNGEGVRLRRLVPYSWDSEPQQGMHDDYPALAVAADGTAWLAWLRYHDRADQVMLVAFDSQGRQKMAPEPVTEPGDHVGPSVAVTDDGSVWLVWAAQVSGNWDVYVRRRSPEGRWLPALRITTDPQPDLHPVIAAVGDRVAVAWQGFRSGQSDVFYVEVGREGVEGDVLQLSPSPRNDWFPAITADGRGNVYVAWDSYDAGNYDVLLRRVTQGKAGPVVPVANTDRFEANVSLACDKNGDVWVAYDEGTKAWGKDYGFWWWYLNWPQGTRLYERRLFRVCKLVGDRAMVPALEPVLSLPAEYHEYSEYPQITVDAHNRLWVAIRHRRALSPRADGWAARGWWEPHLVYWNGREWSEPIPLEDSYGRQDMRVCLVPAAERLWIAWATDGRTPRQAVTGVQLRVHVGVLEYRDVAGASSGLPRVEPFGPLPVEDREVRNVHPNEQEDVQRIREATIEWKGQQLRIYRGDLHRHTDISVDGVGDGSLTDLYRYALDAAQLDFILVADHGMGQDREYPWWRTQKSNDMYHVADRFVPLYGYERSVTYPWGHRNIIWTRRGYRTFPITRAQGRRGPQDDDTLQLYEEMRKTGGIVTLHTSATHQGTNWETGFDPELEPIVELFQGYHTSYEGPGQPLSVDENTPILHGPFRPAGYVWKALEKGYWLGFQASSDHIATHNSYACVLATSLTREALVDGMKRRHTYAATDNIIVDFRMGDAIMGDRVPYSGGPVKLTARIIGTAPIAFIEVIRNGEVVYSVRGNGTRQVTFRWTDPKVPDRDFSYYYLRITQVDRAMAWASPIWIVKNEGE